MVRLPFKQIEAKKVANELKKGLAVKKEEAKKSLSRSPNSSNAPLNINNRDAPGGKANDAARHKVHKSLCAQVVAIKDEKVMVPRSYCNCTFDMSSVLGLQKRKMY